MSQINIHVNPAFEKDLARLMRGRGIRTKSEAIRVAVAEALDRLRRGSRNADFTSWIGLGTRAPMNPSPQFTTDDSLWERPHGG